MPVIDLSNVAELLLKYARKYAYALAIGFFLTVIFSMFISFVASFIIFYNLINSWIEFINSGGNGGAVCQMFGLMSCMGFIDAFNGTKSLLISGALFLLFRILFKNVIRAFTLLIFAVKPLVK